VSSVPEPFADILRQLSPDEAAFLDRCDDGKSERPYLGSLGNVFFLVTGEHAQFGTSPELFELADGMIKHAISLGLIEGTFPRPDRPGPGQDEFHMTPLGVQFVRACRAAGKMGTLPTRSPQELIKHLEKCIYDGDIAAMAQAIGDLHARWDSIGSEMRSDIVKLEAIFLSMLQARARAAPPPPGSTPDSPTPG
jgi:hypothetical protein